MTAPRFPLASIEATDAVFGRVTPDRLPSNIDRALVLVPDVAQELRAFLKRLAFEARLTPRLRELVIMRIGWKTGSAYEWSQHWRLGQASGVTPDELASVRDWASFEGFDSRDRAVLAATDETLAVGRISDETWASCERILAGPDELRHLVMTIGTWLMLSTVLQNLDVPLDDYLVLWPPDGVAPAPSADRSGAQP